MNVYLLLRSPVCLSITVISTCPGLPRDGGGGERTGMSVILCCFPWLWAATGVLPWLFSKAHAYCSGLYWHDRFVWLPLRGVWHMNLPICSSSISLNNFFGYCRALVTLYNPLSSETSCFSHCQHLRAGSIPGDIFIFSHNPLLNVLGCSFI